MRHCDTYQIPAYSLSYLINSDPTGLSYLEIELIDGFLAANFPRGFTVDIDTCIDPYFSSVPAFGLPCEVYDLVMYSNRNSTSTMLSTLRTPPFYLHNLCILLGDLSVRENREAISKRL